MPADSGVFAILAAIVALAASAMAVVLGIDQLLSGARLRSLEAVLREVRGSAGREEREVVISSLHAATVGRLLAREAVPTRHFIVPVLTAIAALAQLIIPWLRVEPGDSLRAPFWGIVTAALIGGVAINTGVYLVRERARVARCYVRGASPIRAYTSILAQMEGGTRGQLFRAYGLSAAIASCAGGASMLLTEATVPSILPPLMIFASVPVAIGLALSIQERLANAAIAEPRNRDNSLKPSWVHPSEPSNVGPIEAQASSREAT